MIAEPAGDKTEAIGIYMTEKTGAEFAPGTFAAFAFLNDNRDFAGAAVVSNFRKTDCEISCAVETPMAFRDDNAMRAVFGYVFNQLGCVRCTSITTKGNKRARAFLLDLGFTLEGNVRLGYDGRKDALIYGLLASECRFISGGPSAEVSAKSE